MATRMGFATLGEVITCIRASNCDIGTFSRCRMAALTGPCSGLQSLSRPSLRSARGRVGRLQVKAAQWTQVDRERPWLDIRADGQPMLAPRTEGMQGDPFGSLLRQRTIFMGGEVEDFSADALVSQLLLLDSQDQGKDIRLFINSPGTSRLALH